MKYHAIPDKVSSELSRGNGSYSNKSQAESVQIRLNTETGNV